MNQTTNFDTKSNTEAKPQSPLDKTKAVASSTIDRTLDTAREAADRTARAIDANPIPALVGGLALGAVIGTLIPRSRRENELLAPVGRKLKATTTGAIATAKQTGLAELGALGLSKGALSDQGGKLVGGILTALVTAGSAALTASREAKANAK